MGHLFLVLLNIELLCRDYMHVAFSNIEPLGRLYECCDLNFMFLYPMQKVLTLTFSLTHLSILEYLK